jgi:hypothetical protein
MLSRRWHTMPGCNVLECAESYTSAMFILKSSLRVTQAATACSCMYCYQKLCTHGPGNKLCAVFKLELGVSGCRINWMCKFHSNLHSPFPAVVSAKGWLILIVHMSSSWNATSHCSVFECKCEVWWSSAILDVWKQSSRYSELFSCCSLLEAIYEFAMLELVIHI